uniref:Uncharacterized protein n=1 Tax=Globisporangium ultimum (strain ATCC 200006 / CBS 805.95 / DAOM BR144) TaxID=431595 RepID=K3WNT2_GLOUD
MTGTHDEEDLQFRCVRHPSGLSMLVPIEKVIPTPAQPHTRHDAKTTCRYASKRCSAPRTTKRNGELHSFCEWHRAKANQNQRRLESKKKLQRDACSSLSTASSPSSSQASSPAAAVTKGARRFSPYDFKTTPTARTLTQKLQRSPQDDYDDIQYPLLSALDPFEPIGIHDHSAWAAVHMPYRTDGETVNTPVYHQQPQYHQYVPHTHTTAHLAPYQPLPLEWELVGDLVGTSVAFASTLQL